jgi:hypothetical protein
MTIHKKKGDKTLQMIVDDIEYGFNKIMSQKRPIYLLTISNTTYTDLKQLQFKIRTFFNFIRKEYRYSFEETNYLSLLEYPEKVVRGNMIPDNCNLHAHIILGTDLKPENIEYYSNIIFNNPDTIYNTNKWYDLRKVSDREDKLQLINYLLKQKNVFTDSSYDYKIK